MPLLKLTIALLSITSTAFCQTCDSASLKAVYRITLRTDSSSFNSYKEDISVLEVGEKYSKYYSYYNFLMDSTLKAEYYKQGGEGNRQLIFNPKGIPSGSTKVILRAISSNIYTVFNELGVSTFKYYDSTAKINWALTPDTTTVNGYKALKAKSTFRGRNWEAWFTSDIPISSGPYLFSGLPGLILKLKEDKGNFNFDLISLTILSNKTPIVLPQKKSMLITRADYRKMYQRMINDPESFDLSQGIKLVTRNTNGIETPSSSRTKSYNPIELE
ncbi:MAG TPA: GLPGLI family protein [Chitinophagaceae bacterium]|nr:GLPGLI family protein [Chitinophagaceae bacterium]HMU59614.1 GLPGLI family protein [Chitinophagaceae bacterium]